MSNSTNYFNITILRNGCQVDHTEVNELQLGSYIHNNTTLTMDQIDELMYVDDSCNKTKNFECDVHDLVYGDVHIVAEAL